MSERKPTRRQKQAVYDRAKGICEYCLSPANYSSDYFSVDHIQPYALGGTNQLSNFALACQGCNSHKFTHIEAIDPMSGSLAPLYHPRRDRWDDHFAWNENVTLILSSHAKEIWYFVPTCARMSVTLWHSVSKSL